MCSTEAPGQLCDQPGRTNTRCEPGNHRRAPTSVKNAPAIGLSGFSLVSGEAGQTVSRFLNFRLSNDRFSLAVPVLPKTCPLTSSNSLSSARRHNWVSVPEITTVDNLLAARQRQASEGTPSNLNHVALVRSGRRLIAFNCHGLEGYFRSPSVEGERKLSRPLFGPAVDVRLVSIRQCHLKLPCPNFPGPFRDL